MSYNENKSCPRCGGHFVQAIEGGESWVHYRCKNCGHRWREDYGIYFGRDTKKITEFDYP